MFTRMRFSFGNRQLNLIRLANSNAHFTHAVSNDNERAEAKAFTAFDYLGRTGNVDDRGFSFYRRSCFLKLGSFAFRFFSVFAFHERFIGH